MVTDWPMRMRTMCRAPTPTSPILMMTDGYDVPVHSTNPIEGDSDGDGLKDGREVNTLCTVPMIPGSLTSTVSTTACSTPQPSRSHGCSSWATKRPPGLVGRLRN